LSQVVATQLPNKVSALPAAPDLDLHLSAQPVDPTDLVYEMGSQKVKLTIQRPLVRAVITEAIENLQAALLFTNAFPDVCVTLTLIKECLFTAATHRGPSTTDILERLARDQDYLKKIIPVVSRIYFDMPSLTALPSHVLEFA
jgi:hypothetical protein